MDRKCEGKSSPSLEHEQSELETGIAKPLGFLASVNDLASVYWHSLSSLRTARLEVIIL